MPQKFIHDVSPELTHEAAYKSFSGIESHALTSGSTVRFLPGTYEMGAVSLDGIIFEGLGARESVVLCNTVATVANTVVFRNLTLSGNSPAAASTAASLFVTNSSNGLSTLKLDRVKFTNGDFGVDSQGLSAIQMDFCDGTGVDRLLRSNSVVAANVNFTVGNLSSNAWFTGANAGLKAATTFMTFGGGANTGNTTKTARSAV